MRSRSGLCSVVSSFLLLLSVALQPHVHVVAARETALAGQGATGGSDGAFAVLAYLPEWRYEGANWDTICRHVSHLIVFSLEVAPSGALTALDRLPRPALLEEARAASRKHSVALLICFGGNGRSAGFAPMVASKSARKRFVKELVALMDRYEFDGVDFNWEYPGYRFGSGYLPDAEVEKDYTGLLLVLEETRAALGPNAPITMSYYPDGRQERLLAQGGAPSSVDYLMMMSYDQSGGHHSEYTWGNKMIDQGASILPEQQVAAGLPFYGRHDTDGNWVTYEDIVQQYAPLPAEVDQVKSKDDGGRPSTLGFNGVVTIEKRTEYAASKIGGVMIWEVGQDCRLVPTVHVDGSSHVRTCPGDGNDASLLAAITRARERTGRKLVSFHHGGQVHTDDSSATTSKTDL